MCVKGTPDGVILKRWVGTRPRKRLSRWGIAPRLILLESEHSLLKSDRIIFDLVSPNHAMFSAGRILQRFLVKRLGLCLLLGMTFILGPDASAAGKSKPVPITYEQNILPLLKDYCWDCHGDGASKGELALDGYTNRISVLQNRKVWEHVLQNVRTSQMPPGKKKHQPTPEQRAVLVKWVEDELFPVDCDNPDPGRVTIRRLNRVEYNNTVRDLLGVDFSPADDFPQDDVGYGFDNIGDVLSMPPVLLERYVAAADQVLDEALVTEDVTRPQQWRFDQTSLDGSAPLEARSNGWLALLREGDVHAKVRVRAAGDYVLRVRAAGEQAGNEPVKMALMVNGKDVRVDEVPELRRAAKVHEIRVRAERGTLTIGARYLNNFVDPKAADPQRRDRNLLLNWIELEGPIDAGPQPLPESHRRVFVQKLVDGKPPQAAAREVIGRFAEKAWRRPLQKGELARLMQLFELGNGQGESFEKSVKIALQAVLVSPHFLFRGEIQPEPDNPKSVSPVGEYALASRLSYFLWGSMPDDELFRLAAARKLRKNLDAQVARMLRDPKSRSLIDNFVAQWLQIRNLDLVSPDRQKFPAFSDALRADFSHETRLFVESLIQENRSVLDLLDSNYSFLNERLAKLYGIEGVAGPEFRKVIFKDRRRGGLLTQGSILTITSNPSRTSPVKRGKWVLETLLGAPPPPPPPNVPELKIDKDHPLTGTLRQKMEQHRSNPMCASCHVRMDAIGFAFENYDAIGAWRTADGQAEIDPSGELGSVQFKGPAELRDLLLHDNKQEFLRCVTEKMLTYALGRGVEPYDRCAVGKILQEMEKDGYRFTSMVGAVIRSVPFQNRRGEGTR